MSADFKEAWSQQQTAFLRHAVFQVTFFKFFQKNFACSYEKFSQLIRGQDGAFEVRFTREMRLDKLGKFKIGNFKIGDFKDGDLDFMTLARKHVDVGHVGNHLLT